MMTMVQLANVVLTVADFLVFIQTVVTVLNTIADEQVMDALWVVTATRHFLFTTVVHYCKHIKAR